MSRKRNSFFLRIKALEPLRIPVQNRVTAAAVADVRENIAHSLVYGKSGVWLSRRPGVSLGGKRDGSGLPVKFPFSAGFINRTGG